MVKIFRIYISIFILFVLQKQCFAENAIFKDLKQNGFGIKEYRYVFIGDTFNKKAFWDSSTSIIRSISDTILLKSIGFGFFLYPSIPSKYSEGSFLIKINKFHFFTLYYRVHILIDKESTSCCIWSFKTEPTGKALKGTKNISEKIGNEFIKRKVLKQLVAKYKL